MEQLEADMDRLREDAAATRTLAAMADRDAAEVRGALRAHTQTLNALRETQVEHGHTLDAHSHALEGHGRTLQTIADGVGGLAVGLDQLTHAVADLTAGQAEIAATVQRIAGDA